MREVCFYKGHSSFPAFHLAEYQIVKSVLKTLVIFYDSVTLNNTVQPHSADTYLINSKYICLHRCKTGPSGRPVLTAGRCSARGIALGSQQQQGAGV